MTETVEISTDNLDAAIDDDPRGAGRFEQPHLVIGQPLARVVQQRGQRSVAIRRRVQGTPEQSD